MEKEPAKVFICKWCGKEIIGTHHNKLIAHQQYCEKNPKSKIRRERSQLGGKRAGQILKDKWKQIKESDEWIQYHVLTKNFEFVCKTCKNTYFLNLTQEEFDKHQYSEFCSTICSHSYSSKYVNSENIKLGMAKSEKVKAAAQRQRKLYICKVCGKQFYVIDSTAKSRTFCSLECKEIFWKNFYARPEIGGKRHGSGRGKKGWYKGYYCDSSWELAWIIYHLEHNIMFKRNTKWFPYMFNDQNRKYFPDFILSDGSYVEIKGYSTEEWKAKMRYFPTNLVLNVLYEAEINKIISYVEQKYGKKWIQLYENNTKINCDV